MLVNFKVALAVKGERQVGLAIRCGMDPTLLSQIINERREAAPELRAKLAAALGVSERWLFTKRGRLALVKAPRPATNSDIRTALPAMASAGRE